MASTDPARRAGSDNLELHILAAVAGLTGVVFTFAAASLDGGWGFLVVPVLTVLLSASGAYLSESYVASMLLGILPIYGVAVGEVVAASYDPLLVGIVNLLLCSASAEFFLRRSDFSRESQSGTGVTSLRGHGGWRSGWASRRCCGRGSTSPLRTTGSPTA